MKKLKIILQGALPPAFNMAVDEVLFRGLETGSHDGFIRLYRWVPPSFSFGYFQPIETLVRLEELRKQGFGIVRRPSGGKMVFHGNEWTFSLGTSIALIKRRFPEGSTFLQYFRSLLTPLFRALGDLGLPVTFAKSAAPRESSNRLACYSTSAGHSIYLGDRKLIGAAGVEKKGNLSIHGSLPISPLPFPRSAFLQDIDYSRLPIAWLENWLTPEQINDLPQTVSQVFAREFEPGLCLGGLAGNEQEEAERLADEKYSDLNWPKNLT